MKFKILDTKNKKHCRSENYNFDFDKNTGLFVRWGKTLEDDPVMAPSCEILDMEISTICSGIGKDMESRRPCSWCYKSNTQCGKNMSFEIFKTIFNKINKNHILTQIAFGIGDIDSNPDLWKIMEYCRDNGVIPNITTNGMGINEEVAKKLAETCGAVAVSRYHIPDVCYDTVARLSEAGLRQVNIHQLLAEETYDSCFNLLNDIQIDPRLAGLKAVVFLMLKPKGNRNKFHIISSTEKFDVLIKAAQEKGVAVGMDSCTAPLMLKFAENNNQMGIVPSIEPCESTLFSLYINVDAEAFPCSFVEGTPGWEHGISMFGVKDFMKDVWFSERLEKWRGGLLRSSSSCISCNMRQHCRSCPAFDITKCKE